MLELLTILTPLEPLKRHQDVRLPRTENTCTWLLNLESFCQWRDSHSIEDNEYIFCCYGIPGAGKTVIWYALQSSIIGVRVANLYYYSQYSSIVIDNLYLQLHKHPNAGIACLYADYKDQTNQILVNILGSFLRQFLTATPEPIPDEIIKKLRNIQHGGRKAETGDILALLKIRLHQLKRAFICIDGVDELESKVRRQLLGALKRLSTTNSRLLFTVRDYIESEVQKWFQVLPEYTVVISASEQDIEDFVRQQINEDPHLNPGVVDEVLEQEILNGIIRKSQGM